MRAFEAAGIWPVNVRKDLDSDARTVTHTERPLLPPHKSPLRIVRGAARLRRQVTSLRTDSPGSRQLQGLLDELGAIGEGCEAAAQIQREIVANLGADAGEEEKVNFKDMRRMAKGRV